VLDRILDKGLVIAGDVKISLANVELLTLQIRLLVCSIDKAEQIGLNWWRFDRNLTRNSERLDAEDAEMRHRLEFLEQEVRRLSAPSSGASGGGRRKAGGAARKSRPGARKRSQG
jgi:hypothetical protein